MFEAVGRVSVRQQAAPPGEQRSQAGAPNYKESAGAGSAGEAEIDNLQTINLNLSCQASAQNSESDNQKEEKLVMEKKIGELEDALRVRLAWGVLRMLIMIISAIQHLQSDF